MPIDPSSAPLAAIKAVQQAMIDRLASSPFATPKLFRADPRSLSLSMPHRVAYLRIDTIEPGDDLRKIATQVGSWRFLVYEQRRSNVSGAGDEKEKYEPIAVVTAGVNQRGDYELLEVSEGLLVGGMDKAIRHAESLPEVWKGAFEAFLLVVPAICVGALWLQDRFTDADIILTIPPANPALVPYQPMASNAFLEILHGLAEKVR